MDLQKIARALGRAAHNSSGGWDCCCPCHEDKVASLSINKGNNGKLLAYCHAGCPYSLVIAEIVERGLYSLPTSAKKTTNKIEYIYTDSEGNYAHTKVKIIKPDGTKTFRQYGPNKKNMQGVTRQLFNAPELKKSSCVYFVEGEKDCETVAGLGLCSTTTTDGAGKWRKEYTQPFKSKDVVVLPDNDEPGKKHAQLIVNKLRAVAASIKIVHLPGLQEKQDISDWVAGGGDREQLLALCEKTPIMGAMSPVSDTGSNLDPYWWPHINDRGGPLKTIENLIYLSERKSIKYRYNLIAKNNEIFIPGSNFSIDERDNSMLATLDSMCNETGFNLGEKLNPFVGCLCQKNQYNPVVDWIDSKPWDGETRLGRLIQSLDPSNFDLALILIRRWAISAIAAAYNPNGVAAQGVLVLQGDQYAGKTSWLKALVGPNNDLFKEGAILNPANKDDVKQVVSYWIVELGELDATFRKSDIAQLKAFITKNQDELRMPYARSSSKFPRRTVLAGSVNQQDILQDQTGNRRFWVVACGNNIDAEHGIDMQQFWAEVKTWFKGGESWYPTKQELALLSESNLGHEAIDPIEELLDKHYDFSMSLVHNMTTTEILISIGYEAKNLTKSQVTRCGLIIRKKTGLKSRRTKTKRFYKMPAIKIGRNKNYDLPF